MSNLHALDKALYYLNENDTENKLTDKQIKYIKETLKNKYSKQLSKLNQNCKKYMSKELKSKCYGWLGDFNYDKYDDWFFLHFAGFDNYAYRISNDAATAKKLMKEMKDDLNSFSKSFSAEMKKSFGNELSFYFGDPDCGLYSISEFINFINDCIDKNGKAPSNSVTLFITCENYNKYIPTELEMNTAENKKYIGMYEKFLKFLKSPSTMPNGIWCAHISDICKIMGISSARLNEIVAKNFKSGKKFDLKVESFEDEDAVKDKISQLGTCYIVDKFSDCDCLIYSATKKHLYCINYEHSSIDSFFDSDQYPYSSDEFVEKIYLKDTGDLKKLFDDYNKEHNIELK